MGSTTALSSCEPRKDIVARNGGPPAPAQHPHNPPKHRSRKPGFRLSWPHAGDARRAVVGKSPSHVSASRNNKSGDVSDARIVHVSCGDVEMHYHFTSWGPNGSTKPILHIPMSWNPSTSEVEDKILFQYFQCVASKSLATFGYDPTKLGCVLIRIALASNTKSAVAVRQSLLALSSLHRSDVHSQAVELKISALNTLAAASGSHLGPREAVQHVAAGMLLCSFEIHQASCTSSGWTWYLRGVKDVINAASLNLSGQDEDLAVLLDWVYYHDVLARFTLRHWRGRDRESTLTTTNRTETSKMAPPAMAMIELLSEVCDAAPAGPPATASAENANDHKSFLKILDWRIRSRPATPQADENSETSLAMELYQLAMLVYLNRASEGILDQPLRAQQQIDRAFTIIAQLSSCDRQFPVFILGCEARRDDQRAAVLDLISRTEKSPSSRSFNYARILMQAIWAQDDLAERNINYYDKLSYVISCCSFVPTFV